MSKPTILIFNRPRRNQVFIDFIEQLKEKYKIVLIADPDNRDHFDSLGGITVEVFYSQEEYQNKCRNVSDQELATLPEIEKELDVNCYDFNTNYLLYRKYLSRYGAGDAHKFMNTHIPQMVYIWHSFLKNIIEKYNVKYCYYETLDTVSAYLVTAMAKKGIIKQAFEHAVESIGADARLRVSTGQYRDFAKLTYILDNDLISDNSKKWAKKAIDQNKEKRVISKYDEIHLQRATLLPRYSLEQVIDKIKRVLGGESFLPALIKLRKRFFSQKYFSKSLPKSKIITYFLQLTPEASMCSQVPQFADQEYLIEQMAIHGKYGYTIVVKEHPVSYGNRDIQFYKELAMLPNVILLPPSYPTRDLILASTAVVVATGTSAGLESILVGTPVIALGNPYFNVCDNVFKIERPEDVWDIIEQVKCSPKSQHEFIAAFYEATYEHPQFDSFEDHEIGAGVGKVAAAAIDAEISLYELGELK